MTETKPKKKMGRPLKNPGEPRTASLKLRLTVSEKETISKAAELAGLSVTAFIVVTAQRAVSTFEVAKVLDR